MKHVVLATWYIRSKKDGPSPLRSLLSLDTELDGGTGEPVLLTGWREEDAVRQAYCRRSSSTRSQKPSGCRVSSLLSKESGHDDPLAPLDSLMEGRRRYLLVTPPFGSHGAVQTKLEQQPPWFLLAQWHEMFQRSWGSAAGSLDAVVPG